MLAQKGKFFLTLDGIRGVAAILIVMRHAEFVFQPFVFQESYLAVDLFFVLSGVVICQAYEERIKAGLSWYDFLVVRLIRIYPLYIVGSVVGLFNIIVSSRGYFGGVYSFSEVSLYGLLQIFMVPNPFTRDLFPLNLPSWSLFFEIIANLIFAVSVMKYSDRFANVTVVIFGALVGLCIWTAPSLSISDGYTLAGFHVGFIRVMYSFFVGVLIFRRFKATANDFKGSHRIGAYVPYLIVGVVIFTLTADPSPSIQPFFDFLSVVVLFPCLVYVSLFFQPLGLGAKIYRFIGSISYTIYIIHAPLVSLMYGVLKKGFALEADRYAPWSGLCFVLVLAILCVVIEKYYDLPIRRFFISRRGDVRI